MISPGGCRWSARVDAHFAGTISVADEQALRGHLLEGCSSCRLRYTRQSMLSRLLPGETEARQRIGRALGLRPRSARAAGWLGLVAACGVLALFAMTRPPDLAPLQARGGGGVPRSELLAFRVAPGGRSEQVRQRFAAVDRLAFAYRNGGGKRFLYVFGVDEHRHVYWFSPAWTDPGRPQPPAPAFIDGDLHEIEHAVAHAYDGDRLQVFALFTDRAWSVRDLDARIVRSGAAPLSDEEIWLQLAFEVTR